MGEIVSRGGKAQAEVRRRIEAIAGSQQDSTFGGGPAEPAVVLSAKQPGECGHPALRRNPAEYLAVVRHEAFEELEVSGGDAACVLPSTTSCLRTAISERISPVVELQTVNKEPRGPVLLAALRAVLDHPSRAHAGNRECF